MLSDVSELTDLEDEEYLPPFPGSSSISSKPTVTAAASTRSEKSSTGKCYQLKNSLRPPRVITYTARALYDQISSGFINLDPEYQRGVVWNGLKQVGLIDSLLGNYFVPPIIFAVSVDEKGNELRTCIDGKQRLTSIQRFMDGLIPHKDTHTNLKLWYKNTKDHMNGRVLPPHIKQQFDTKQVMCVEYERIAEDAEREIFKRVQLGMALTAAERMRAITGAWPDLIRDLIRKYFPSSSSAAFEGRTSARRTEDLAQLIEWCATRGRDFHLIGNILFYLEKNISKVSDVPTHPSAPTLTTWLEGDSTPSEKLKKKINEIFKIFMLFARNRGFSRIFSKPHKISPAEFIMASILISQKMGECTVDMLANAIAKMKADVRTRFEDVRTNTKTLRHMFEFILERFPKEAQLVSRVKNTGNSGDHMRDERPAVTIAKSFNVGIPPTSSNVRKRKRIEDATSTSEAADSGEDEKTASDEDSDSEAEPISVPVTPAARRRGRPPKVANTGVRNLQAKAPAKISETSSPSNVRAAKRNHFLMKKLSDRNMSPSTSILAASVHKSPLLPKSQKESPSSIREPVAHKPKSNAASRDPRTQDFIDLSTETDTDEGSVPQKAHSSNPNHTSAQKSEKIINGSIAVEVKQEQHEPARPLHAEVKSSVSLNQERRCDTSGFEGEDIRMVDSALLQSNGSGSAVAATASVKSSEIAKQAVGVQNSTNTNLAALLHELSQVKSLSWPESPTRPAAHALTSTTHDRDVVAPQILSVDRLQTTAANLKVKVEVLSRSLQSILNPFQPVDGTVNPEDLVDAQPTYAGVAMNPSPAAKSSLFQTQGALVTNDILQIPAVSTPVLSIPNSSTSASRSVYSPRVIESTAAQAATTLRRHRRLHSSWSR